MVDGHQARFTGWDMLFSRNLERRGQTRNTGTGVAMKGPALAEKNSGP